VPPRASDGPWWLATRTQTCSTHPHFEHARFFLSSLERPLPLWITIETMLAGFNIMAAAACKSHPSRTREPRLPSMVSRGNTSQPFGCWAAIALCWPVRRCMVADTRYQMWQ
jgi:hypothetical protein